MGEALGKNNISLEGGGVFDNGQLGMFCRQLADCNVNILVQYSDHSNQLIIVPDNYGKAKEVSEAWMK